MWVRDVLGLFIEGGNDIQRKLVQGEMLSLYKHLEISNGLPMKVTDWLTCKVPQWALYPLQHGKKSVGFGAQYIWAGVPGLPLNNYYFTHL